MTLSEIKRGVLACRECPLATGRPVFGEAFRADPREGDPLILVVGEAPGRNEEEQGRTHVGAVGKILRDDLLAGAGVRLAFVANAVCCRPPGNRDPVPAEVGACARWIRGLVEALRPDGILCVGKFAAEAVESGAWGEDLLHLPRVSVIHPSALLRRGYPNAATAKTVNVQVTKIRRLLARFGVTEAPAAPVVGDTAAGDGAACEHDPAAVGAWVLPGGIEVPMAACRKCGRLSDPA